MKQIVASTVLLLSAAFASAGTPRPATELSDWPMPYVGTFPAVSATDLLDKPAGKNGPVVVRDGHFYTGQKRIRFWGANMAFAANFPAHETADKVAARLSTFGINAVRLHHMDNQVFPNGIWADKSFEKLSPEALDRLDYFIAALAKQGIYCDLNLHVSRPWSRSHQWPNAEQLPDGVDKLVDIFYPDLIAANKQYARDLLGHVNAYTQHRYADEPSICVVEINNEDTLFLWGSETNLSRLPEPYAGVLTAQWNQWLTKKYATRDQLKAAWAVGEAPFGAEMLKWTVDAPKPPRDYTAVGKEWILEQGGTGRLTATGVPMPNDAQGVQLAVTKVDGTDWHVQFFQPGLKLEKGKFYTVQFSAQSAKPVKITVGVSQAHAPWQNLGLGTPLKFDATLRPFSLGFTATADDDNGRLAFVLGQGLNTFTLTGLSVREGGRLGLHDAEDQVTGRTVASHKLGAADTAARSADWFDFLQQTDEAYFVGMRDFLKTELGVKAPITGTIGLGPLSTASQSKMDFVDAHAYWDHPSFPHKDWDPNDWLVKNTAMVDDPAGATFWDLAGTRVAGKPFTVTEYCHPAPNDFAAECVPMIASYAALQDWDAVFLFAYSHNGEYDKQRIASYFDIEGNPTKMPFMPMASRIFLGQDVAGAITPLATRMVISPDRAKMLNTASVYHHEMWRFLHNTQKLEWPAMLTQQFALRFDGDSRSTRPVTETPDPRVAWTANGPGTGRYTVADAHGVVFVGAKPDAPVDLGLLRIEKLETPFVSMMLVPADPAQPIATADRLLLTAVAQAENTGMVHSADRKTVGTQWGKAPVRIEVVKGELSLPAGAYQVFAITPDGTRGDPIETKIVNGRCVIPLGRTPTVWYEVVRGK